MVRFCLLLENIIDSGLEGLNETSHLVAHNLSWRGQSLVGPLLAKDPLQLY